MIESINIGLDIGSTTIKVIVTDEEGKIVFSRYERHNAKIIEKTFSFLSDIKSLTGDVVARMTITGSIGLGLAERYDLPFIQEVVAASEYVKQLHPEVTSMIDIGGEDAKVVFFHSNQSVDLRMNGNCAGGTGAFIDQMAILLDVTIDQLNEMALRAERIYPIASRCGVFCKTDIQNLVAKNAAQDDIAASIFHAVAVQTVVTLSHGCEITAPLLFCGGPLTFIPALRKAFADYLHLSNSDIIVPEKSNLISAWGAALSSQRSKKEPLTLSALIERIREGRASTYQGSHQLPALFKSEEQMKTWQDEKLRHRMEEAPLTEGDHDVVLGIDSGSTTTKIVVLDEAGRLLYSYYNSNKGNPIAAVRTGLDQLEQQCREAGARLHVKGSCSTGYGEDLIRAAFRLNGGIIETIAHYLAARHINKDVSFILDIGGQDMKAIFVQGGVINHIEINEACSSGCGTFIETFAKSMNYSVTDFALEACRASQPCDLGTRCTVFMNSKVKQVLREGATIGDIASGLSYSVINNCLHKVLKIKSIDELGDHIVVQGGTMHNDSVVRALEHLIGKPVFRSDRPELMGAYGCALYASLHATQSTPLSELIHASDYETRQLQCHGCENACLVNRYTFSGGNVFYSGNRCERVFTNRGKDAQNGRNLYTEKYRLLFDRTQPELPADAPTIGIPRVLNLYEEYPFWHTLLTECGLRVVLSEESTYKHYETGVKTVMADNICFPAKLVHSHILNLVEKGVDRILFPYVIYERSGVGQNSFNCPIVSGYSDVIRSAMDPKVPIDSPTITFRDPKALYKQCRAYLKTFGLKDNRVRQAFRAAMQSFDDFEHQISALNLETWEASRRAGRLTILLAGRPYHSDPLIQHKLSDMISAMGVDVITDDIVRGMDLRVDDMHFMSQWSFPEHIQKAAQWVARQDANVQFIELTSFGCGPDAFLLDEIHTLLSRHGKTLTLLKIDDVCNIGSLKLRVRSVIDSLKLNYSGTHINMETRPFVTTPAFTEELKEKHRKIVVPYFTSFIAPLIPSFMKLAGYDVDVLPMSDVSSDDWGLKFANNEICYPATLIVGDVIKAFKSGHYDPETTTVAMTQTGGQCRASNYMSLIKKALVEAGYPQVPVISLALDKSMRNEQPAFRVNWTRLIPIAFASILYSDCIAKYYYAAAPREKELGLAAKLRDKYLDIARSSIERRQSHELINYLAVAARDFDRISSDRKCPRVGIVGEIFLKFNPYAQRHITEWLVENHIEVEPPILLDFFLQGFVNRDVNHETLIDRSGLPKAIVHAFYRLARHEIRKVNTIGSAFRYFHPFDDIFELAREAREVVSLSAQFGEGWLLPGEVSSYARQGIHHVISMQPFGCIANHIISKGIEKRIRTLYPDINFLTLDFDSGVSDVNITNRLLLFTHDLIES